MSHQSLFSVSVNDVEREEQERAWTIPPEWMDWALGGSEADKTAKTGRLTAYFMKNGRQFLVRGQIDVQVQLPCARTLEPAVYDLKPPLFLMLTREGAGPPRRSERRPTKRSDDQDALSEEDAAHDTFSGETIVLDDFVREQLLLELPMFPLRSDLRLQPSAAIASPPQTSEESPAVDPRLAPLQKLAEQMRASETPKTNGTPPDKASEPSAKK